MVSGTSSTLIYLVKKQLSSGAGGQSVTSVFLPLWVSWFRAVSFRQLCQLSYLSFLWTSTSLRKIQRNGERVTDSLGPQNRHEVSDRFTDNTDIYSAWPFLFLLNYVLRCISRSLRDFGNYLVSEVFLNPEVPYPHFSEFLPSSGRADWVFVKLCLHNWSPWSNWPQIKMNWAPASYNYCCSCVRLPFLWFLRLRLSLEGQCSCWWAQNHAWVLMVPQIPLRIW